jgi:hypothetical protein
MQIPPQKIFVASIFLVVLMVLVISVHATPIPYMSFSLPYVPAGGFRPFDTIQVDVYMSGAGHNITHVIWNWGDGAKADVTYQMVNFTTQIYHAYLHAGTFMLLGNATTDLCYAPSICQYFTNTYSIVVGGFLTTTTLMVAPPVVDVAQHQAFQLSVNVKANGKPVPYANVTLYASGLVNGAPSFVPIGAEMLGPNGAGTFFYYPLEPDTYAFEAVFHSTADYENSSAFYGFADGNQSPVAIPEFPIAPLILTLSFLIVLCVRRKWGAPQ